MILSMTGYGKASIAHQDKKITVEVKSLNSKAFDLSARIAPLYREREMEIRNILSKSIERGKVDFSIWIEKENGNDATPINAALVNNYYEQIKAISAQTGIEEPKDWFSLLLRMPEVMTRTEVEELTEEECKFYYDKQFEFILALIEPDEEVNLWIEKNRDKYNMIILTNGKSKEQRMKLKKLGLENVFKLYISGEKHISKPKEGAFLNVLESEEILPEETMMIGDSLYHDINPAKKLGMKTCLVEKKWHFDDELKVYTGYKVKNIKQFFTELDKL